ncbi:MAG: FprA family A-type flavoprotein [Clostridiales bacterium]|nr:FprA family A-type flavoprotein [Clostridiales bacterium]
MASKMLKEGLYSVGVLNPNLRVFDIIMRTEYGTSYNSYVVKDKQTALIETCHEKFFDEYVENISEVTSLDDIDYIVVSHTEPDHSGALAKLVTLCKNAKIVCTKAASIYLKNITNLDNLNLIVVKDGDSISLGDIELKFISAPFLHWPDTMFTYIEKLSTVVTCDFLGAHYCEPKMVDSKITYPDKYLSALKEYYDAIMGPFKPYVLSGLEKLSALKFDTALVSHGPVLTKDGMLDKAMSLYKKWSSQEKTSALHIPIFYCSAYGYTKKLALKAKEVILEKYPKAKIEAYNIIDHELSYLANLLNSATAFMVGSPTLNKDAVAPVWSLLSSVDAINNQKKAAAVFGSYGWSGEAVPAILARLNSLRIKTVGEGFRCTFSPSEKDLNAFCQYVDEFITQAIL